MFNGSGALALREQQTDSILEGQTISHVNLRELDTYKTDETFKQTFKKRGLKHSDSVPESGRVSMN